MAMTKYRKCSDCSTTKLCSLLKRKCYLQGYTLHEIDFKDFIDLALALELDNTRIKRELVVALGHIGSLSGLGIEASYKLLKNSALPLGLSCKKESSRS